MSPPEISEIAPAKKLFTANDILVLFGLYGNLTATADLIDNKYFWFDKGFRPARALSQIVVLALDKGWINGITPMSAWDRYS